MRFASSLVFLPVAIKAANLVLSNDDGWAEINIRTFFSVLTAAGELVILSAPALD
jgi:broad specificity polyphosphatase/5'/3'-nucleotidase SurE